MGEAALQELAELLGQVPPPLQALDLSALDGYLAGVLLQPRRIPAARWLPFATDDRGRAWPATWALGDRLQQLIEQRHAELDALIEARQWFDPWITDVGPETLPAEAVQGWVLGFATACSEFEALTEGPGSQRPDLLEALAQLYQHLNPEDLEDADALLAEIETLEPPTSVEDAVESLVRACLLLADISRPLAARKPSSASRTARRGR
ncbi:MAG: YecA family protein [Betaproteobacteria bacterium]|nr:YecA family protein [Betaproteobacteria bacterium]